MVDLALIAKAGAALLTDRETRKRVGQTLALILSPLVLLVAFLCCLASGTAQHNAAAADLCFLGGPLPEDLDSEYREAILTMRKSLGVLDLVIAQVQEQTPSGSGLNASQIQAAFFSLCFGDADLPISETAAREFVDCFVRYEQRTVQETGENGDPVLVEYTAAIPLPLGTACRNLEALGYGVKENTADTIQSAYERYAYHGGSFSGEVAYGAGGDTDLTAAGFTDPDTKNAEDLVVYVTHAWENQWGYVWGTFGQVLTESLLEQKTSQYPSGVGDKEKIIREKWLGSRTADCVGLIKSYGWMDADHLRIRYGSGGMPDIGADAMYYNAQVKGSLDTMPETPGLAVWRSGHIGVYVGDGEVIEAMGTAYGVVRTQLAERSWTAWLEIPYISYD